ncbi:MAG: GatB/YqeY domain-containing protein [Nitrospinota bacterium]|nr:GatB/YqeY domain-containing protein [Nitrospinota bacterium]
MSLRSTLDEDLKKAMKGGDRLVSDAIRMVKSEMKTREVAKGASGELDDNAIIDVISTLIKKGKESVRLYEEGGRQELADKEKAEIAALSRYLPAQLSEDEVREKVKSVIAKLGNVDIKAMGQVMKSVMAEVGKSADGSLVSRLVKETLSK